MTDTPKTVRVYPHPDLAARSEYLAGVGIDGADVAPELAEEWLAAGLAVDKKPRSKASSDTEPAADAAPSQE